MKIYLLLSEDWRRRRPTFRGHTFDKAVKDCPTCKLRDFERIFPASVEFTDNQPVADIHDAVSLHLAEKHFGDQLAHNFPGIQPVPITIYKGVSRFTGQEALPYHGPEMVELWFPHFVDYNPELSPLKIQHSCPACRCVIATVQGVGEGISETLHDRYPGSGIRMPLKALKGNMAFRYGGGRMLVLEPVKEFIEKNKSTNARFIEYGEVI